MYISLHMYAIHNQNKKIGFARHQYKRWPGINKIKIINILNEKKSYNGLNINKRKKNMLKKNQTRQVIFLFGVIRYNFHYLKKLLIKFFC